MPTLADIKAADLDRVWFDTARGLAELAQGPAGEIPVRFSNDFAEARGAGDLVVNGSRPVVAVRASDAGPLKRLYPKNTEVLRMATAKEIELISACREAAAAHKEVGERLDFLKAQLQAQIGFHEGLAFGADKVTWKAQKGRLNPWATIDQLKQLAAGGSLDLAAIEKAIKDNTPETQRVLRLGGSRE